MFLKIKYICLKVYNNLFNNHLNHYFYKNNYYLYTNKYNNFILNSFYKKKHSFSFFYINIKKKNINYIFFF